MDRGEAIANELAYLEKLSKLAGRSPVISHALRTASAVFRKLEPERFPQSATDLRKLIGFKVADDVREAIFQLIAGGRPAMRDELEHEIPEGVRNMLLIPDLEVMTIRNAWKEHGIDSLEVMILAVKTGNSNLKRIGEATKRAVFNFERDHMPSHWQED